MRVDGVEVAVPLNVMAWLRKIEEYLVYPAAWTLDPAPTPWATLSMTLVPPDDEIGTRIVFLLADGETAAKMIANGTMVPRPAAVVAQANVTIGGRQFSRTEWRGEFANDPTYRHSVELPGDVGGRCLLFPARELSRSQA